MCFCLLFSAASCLRKQRSFQKNLTDKRTSLTGIAAASPRQQHRQQQIKTVHPGELNGRLSYSLCFCLFATSTAHSDWDSNTDRQASRQAGRQAGGQAGGSFLWQELRKRSASEMVKAFSFLEYSVARKVSFCLRLYVYVFICVEREKKSRELRSGLRFAGSLGAGSCLFGLGSTQGGHVPTAPDDAGLFLANILSSDSGDRLNWERLANGSASHKAVSTQHERTS